MGTTRDIDCMMAGCDHVVISYASAVTPGSEGAPLYGHPARPHLIGPPTPPQPEHTIIGYND